MNRTAIGLMLVSLLFVGRATFAQMALYDKNGWKFSISGDITTEVVSDTTRSFRDFDGSFPVERNDGAPGSFKMNGDNGRMIVDSRKTNWQFWINTPDVSGWKFAGKIDMDLRGLEQTPYTPGSTNFEATYYQFPDARVREEYFSAKSDHWSLVAGTTWSLFGWENEQYALPTFDGTPQNAMLFLTPAQIRAVRSFDLSDSMKIETGVAVEHSVQSDSGQPAYTGGVRLSFPGITGPLAVGGRTIESKPMSFAVSGLYSNIVVPDGAAPAAGQTLTKAINAIAADLMIPIIPNSEERKGGTLTVNAEAAKGSGYGYYFPGFTGNAANPENNAVAGTSTATISGAAPIDLDGGVGDYDSNKQFHLIDMEHWMLRAQYHMPTSIVPMWFSAGASGLHSPNMHYITAGGGYLTSLKKIAYDGSAAYWVQAFYDLTDSVRFNFQWSHMDTSYIDGATAANNRYMLAVHWIF